MKERKAWTKQQDEVLKLLKQIRGQKKWSTIAKKMEEQYSISGRSGKQCRQRYHNHLDATIKQTEWTPEQEKILFEMHDEVGNRWSVISHHLSGRTDNGVKNHFYSKLRKAVRRINKIISENYKKEYKQIKTSLLYKIIETSQSKFKVSSMIDQQVADYCTDIKNKLFYFQENFEENQPDHIDALKQLIEDILNFGKNDKRVKVKHRKSSVNGKDLLHPHMYLKKAHSHSQYSQSDSSRVFQSSSYGDDQSEDQNGSSVGHKSMMNISKRQTNPSKSYKSNTNLRLTRSRSKEETFSSNKSPDCFSDDANVNQKNHIHAFTGDTFLNLKQKIRSPSFDHEKPEWGQNNEVEEILMADNVIEQRSSGSNKNSRNSRSNSLNNSRYSHVNLFFEDSQFEMRILSPKNFAQEQKMSEESELFDQDRMQVEGQMDRYSVESIRTLNLGHELSKFGLGHKQMLQESKQEDLVKEEQMVKEKKLVKEQERANEPERIPLFRFFESESSDQFKKEREFQFEKESS